MEYATYEKQFRKKASTSGFSEDDILKCLAYAEPLIAKNLPIIYNTSNLSALVGYRKNYLKRAVLFTPYFYREFTISKKNGEKRILKEPLPSLKEIQIWILNNILYKIPVSRFAKAYVPKRSILDNIRFHKKKKKILTLDIENFFSSIHQDYITNIFCELGYSPIVSSLLSKICCCDNMLPQGAPTSPYLSNLYLNKFDELVAKYCIKNEIRYTRYADDMVFSGEFDSDELISFVQNNLTIISLKLNTNKIKIMQQSDQQIITGVVVNDVGQIPKIQRKEIRQEIFYIKKYGLTNHLQKTNNNKANYILHLLGKINYALFINPNDKELEAYKKYIYGCLFATNKPQEQ